MIRQPYYTIDSKAYLFLTDDQKARAREDLEEPVRQWYAFELIRAYGINIQQISFEHEARVGSKNYKIDILLKRNGRPWAVIECKKRSHQKHQEAIEQARSYGVSERINAEYIVYTNSDVWLVERRVEGAWVRVSDLPNEVIAQSSHDLILILNSYEYLGALLHKLHQDIQGETAHHFLSFLQRFFNSHGLLLASADHNLVSALDFLLRSTCDPSLHSNYRREKLTKAFEFFECFRKERGLPIEFYAKGSRSDFNEDRFYLASSLDSCIDSDPDLPSDTRLLMQLASSIASYSWSDNTRLKKMPRLPNDLLRKVERYLDWICRVHLHFELPDINERSQWQLIEKFTEKYWLAQISS